MGIGAVWVGRGVGDAVGRGNGRLLGPGVAAPDAMDIGIGVDVRGFEVSGFNVGGFDVRGASSGARVQPAAKAEERTTAARTARSERSTFAVDATSSRVTTPPGRYRSARFNTGK